MKFGALLKALRQARGLSLRELGALARTDHAYLYRLETGAKDTPSASMVAAIMRALKADAQVCCCPQCGQPARLTRRGTWAALPPSKEGHR